MDECIRECKVMSSCQMIIDRNEIILNTRQSETSIICTLEVLPLQVMQSEHFIIIDPPFIL